jgi:hypothetical protein
MVTPNLQEARRAVDPDSAPDQPVDLELAHEIGRKLRGMLRASTIAVTMADQGVLLTGPDGEQAHVPCHPFLAPVTLARGIPSPPPRPWPLRQAP